MKDKYKRSMNYIGIVMVVILSIVMLSCNEEMPNNGSVNNTPTLAEDPVLKAILQKKKIPEEKDLEKAFVSTKQIFEPYKDFVGRDLKVIYISPNGAGAKNGSSWSNASAGDGAGLKTIIENANASSNEIYLLLLSKGTYKPETALSMKDYVAIVGGWDSLSLGRNSSTISVLDGNKDKRVFFNENIEKAASLYGVTISNGYSGDGNAGGGMYNSNSSPTITSVIFSSNIATNGGGGMHNIQSSPVLTSLIFVGNNAGEENGYGGGMNNIESSSPVLTNVEFSENSSRSGGGMFNSSSSPMLTDVKFSKNVAQKAGGGMGANSNSSLVFTNVEFSENVATTSAGGGVYSLGATVVFTNVQFFKNSAPASFGGGVYTQNTTVTLKDVNFSDNFATSGGGVISINSPSTFNNVNFLNNSGEGDFAKGQGLGGGMAIQNFASASIFLTDVVFSGNKGTLSGGLYSQSSGSAVTTLILKQVKFYGNETDRGRGGGLFLQGTKARLTDVFFIGNKAAVFGAGMTAVSSPIQLINTVFYNNIGARCGGGLHLTNQRASVQEVKLIGLTVVSNSATGNDGGGGLCFNAVSETADNVMVNSIVIRNTVNGNPAEIFYRDTSQYTTSGHIQRYSNIYADPQLGGDYQLLDSLLTGVIPLEGSRTINKGLYVRANVDYTNFYYSVDGNTWYNSVGDATNTDGPGSGSSAVAVDLSQVETIDLTKTDILGNERVGKPDVGAFEFQ